MSITWFNDKDKDIVVTITSKSITINKVGKQFFETANAVMLGFDEDSKRLIIKPLTKDDVLRGDIPKYKRYNISMSSSYVRITNKAFIEKLDTLFNLSLSNEGKRYRGTWELKLGALDVSLEEVE